MNSLVCRWCYKGLVEDTLQSSDNCLIYDLVDHDRVRYQGLMIEDQTSNATCILVVSGLPQPIML
jgi:hypothetical protein